MKPTTEESAEKTTHRSGKMYDPLSDVVTVQPRSPPPPAKDYLGWSIMNLICCCFPLGLIALVFSIKTRDANHQNDPISAAQHSGTVCGLNIAATVIGILVTIVVFIFYVVLAQNGNDRHY